jgi:hypothetical protein
VNPSAATGNVARLSATTAAEVGASVSSNDSNAGGDSQNSSTIGQIDQGENTSASPSQVTGTPQFAGVDSSGNADNGSANTADFGVTDGTNDNPDGSERYSPEVVVPVASYLGPTIDYARENRLAVPASIPLSDFSLIRGYVGLSIAEVRLDSRTADYLRDLPPKQRDPSIGPGPRVISGERLVSTTREESGDGDTIRVPVLSDLMDVASPPDWQTLGRDLRQFLSRFGSGEDTPDVQGWSWQTWVAILAAVIASRAAAQRVGLVARRDAPPDGRTSRRFPGPPGPWPLGLS